MSKSIDFWRSQLLEGEAIPVAELSRLDLWKLRDEFAFEYSINQDPETGDYYMILI